MNTITRLAPRAARLTLGFVFFVFGLNGFLNFLPQPVPPERAMAFFGALAATGYMLPLIKSVEVVAGALLLSNRYVPLALALVAPNVVNIVLFHTVLAPAGLPIALFVLALEVFTAWSYRDSYAPMLRARTSPVASATTGAAPAHAMS